MRVAELNLYPVKSTRARPVERATVEPWGLLHDRRWMVVDPQGKAVTARADRGLLGITATVVEPGRLRLEGPLGAAEVTADRSVEPVAVAVWGSQVDAVPAGVDADRWVSAQVGRDVRLVWLADPSQRPVSPAYSRPGDRVGFGDAFPLLLTTTASLAQLNDWVSATARERGAPASAPLSMARFRPNLVVDTDEPFAEDRWRSVEIGAVAFRVAKPCDRCVLTTVDPDTLVSGPEPIRTLARHRRWDGKVWFGMNLIPDSTGTLEIGATVTARP